MLVYLEVCGCLHKLLRIGGHGVANDCGRVQVHSGYRDAGAFQVAIKMTLLTGEYVMVLKVYCQARLRTCYYIFSRQPDSADCPQHGTDRARTDCWAEMASAAGCQSSETHRSYCIVTLESVRLALL